VNLLDEHARVVAASHGEVSHAIFKHIPLVHEVADALGNSSLTDPRQSYDRDKSILRYKVYDMLHLDLPANELSHFACL
jgi:hypothetical protein